MFIAFVRHRATSILSTGIHAVLVLVMVGLGVVLLLPDDTFDTGRGYLFFIQHWPHTENGWAVMFFVAAVVGLPGLLPNHTTIWRIDTGWPRIISTILLACAHVCLAYATARSNPASFGTVLFTSVAGMGFLRIVVEAARE